MYRDLPIRNEDSVSRLRYDTALDVQKIQVLC